MVKFTLVALFVAVPLWAFVAYIGGLIKDRVSPEPPIPTATIASQDR